MDNLFLVDSYPVENLFRVGDILWITALVAVLLAWGICCMLIFGWIGDRLERKRERKRGKKK